nr:hypothetical protein [Deltaproteobacteria bacterium]
MVARSEAPGFSPVDRPRVAIASDGTLAAISESTRVVVLEIPGAEPFAEIGIDGEALANEMAWVGAPPRLIVLSRYAAHSTVHLIDPYGPRTIAEIRLEAPMKLFATVGAHALAVSSMGAAVLTASDTHLTPYQFPARSVPVTAGAAAGNFVVALSGSIEEWDPQARMPKRRLRLPKPAVITAVGGSDRVVWMTTQQDPTRLDVIPLVNRGQPKFHDLPEPIAQAVGHPRSDLVVCLGADTGRLYVVDLDGRTRLRVLGPEGIDRAEAAALIIGRMVGVLAAQTRKQVVIVGLDGREPEADAAGPSAAPLISAPEPEPVAARSTLGADEEIIEVSVDDDDDLSPSPPPGLPPMPPPVIVQAAPSPIAAAPTAPSLFRHTTGTPTAIPRAAAAIATKPTVTAQSLSDKFSAWRDRMRQSQPRSEQSTTLPWFDTRPSWRDEVVTWARGVVAGSVERGAPIAPPIDAIAIRFDLPAQLVPALLLLYGAHLGGERGAAPVDVARVLGRRWDEALGTGQLAERGIASYVDSRVILAAPVRRALDEVAVTTGTLLGEAGANALLGPCVVVAGDQPLAVIAERCLASVGGAILAARDDVDPTELFVEARARGAAPMLQVSVGD